jgi:HK97 family phage major capsid protein
MTEMELALKAHGQEIKEKQAEMQKAIEANLDAKAAELKKSVDEMEAHRREMQRQLDDQNMMIQKAEKTAFKEEAIQSLEKGMRDLLDSKEFKEAKAAGFKGGNVFQIKADTSNITGTVNLTAQKLAVKFNPERALAFIPYLNVGVVGADKNRVLWVEGAYTSNVGYVGEGTGQANADTATATEKTRQMAKISAKLPLTAELLEDADYIASAFRMKMQEKAMLFVDNEVYGGDGSDGVNPNHIYGIKGHATAFNAAVVTTKVANANIADLIDAVILQAAVAEQRGLNVIWINPKDWFAFKKVKDTDGQYIFVKDVNGNYTINGINVVVSNAVTANTLTMADTNKIQLWWKRNPEVKFSQMNGTDFVDDTYTAVMFLRNQLVVETPDKTAVVHVADITAAITAIKLV